jgi:hypothetical protein
MTTLAADRWHIPRPAEAARAPAGRDGDQAGRLARIAGLDGARMADGLAFLAGYAPGVFDAVLTATEPCLDDLFPAGDDALEPYCTRCGAKAGVFIARGSDWRHYAGDAEDRSAAPFETDHAPVIGWRPAVGRPGFVAL